MIRQYQAVLTGPAGTVDVGPFSGYVSEIRLPNAGTALTGSGTADFTFTRKDDGGTVLALTDKTAPFSYQPRPVVHTVTGGTTAYTVGGQSR